MIPIVMITDSNYVFATRITIRSLLKYKNPDTEYKIHVLGVGLTAGDIDQLHQEYPETDVQNLENRYQDICKVYTHVSTAALYKFDMADLFPQYDKIIYVDVDVLILDDLTELFQRDISDVYVGAVLDYRGMAMLKLEEKMNLKYYFFSSMMVCNLTMWRKENIRDKCLDLKRNNTFNGFMDQDAFNAAFHDRILVLPVKYSCPAMIYWGKPGLLESFYSGEELAGMQCLRDGSIEPGKNVVVMHFFMRNKPWKSLRNNRYMRYWWTFLTPGEAIPLYGKLIVAKIRHILGIR